MKRIVALASVLFLTAACAYVGTTGFAAKNVQRGAAAAQTQKVAEAARALLGTLSAERRQTVMFDFTHSKRSR